MIVIMRHGAAQRSCDSDFNRRLTADGIADVRKRAEYLRLQNITFDLVMVSPYIRTLQTLEIIREAVGISEVSITRELVPSADSGIADYLRVLHDQGKKVLVISHMPLVGMLVRELAGNHLSGFMNPADLNILDSNGDGEKLKVIYSTNCYDLNA